MDYTITLSDMEKKAMETITPDVDDWITNVATNRARIAKEEIIAMLITHCNENNIAIATGEAAQVDQAYALKLVSKLEAGGGSSSP